MTKAGWTVLAVHISGLIVFLLICHHFFGNSIAAYIVYGSPIALFVYFFFIHPLAWIVVKLGLCEWIHIFPPDPPRKHINYGKRHGKEEE